MIIFDCFKTAKVAFVKKWMPVMPSVRVLRKLDRISHNIVKDTQQTFMLPLSCTIHMQNLYVRREGINACEL